MLSDAGAHDLRKMIGDLTDGGITFAFDHDAEQRFGAGIPHQHTAAPVEGRYGGVVDLPNSSASLALPTGIFDTDILPKGALNDAARFGRPGTRCKLS